MRYRIIVSNRTAVMIGNTFFTAQEALARLQMGVGTAKAEDENGVEYSLQDLEKIVAALDASDA